MATVDRPPTEPQAVASHLATRLQHAGCEHRVGKGLVSALEQSVTFRVDDPTQEPVYARLSNTANNLEVCEVLAVLFGAEDAFVTNSGMSALSLILATELRAGDHMLCLDNCYASTRGLLQKILPRWGVEVSFVPADGFEAAIQSNTRLLLTESISNPFCTPQDLRVFCELAKRRGLVSVVDNTFASPLCCHPLAWGSSYSFESATKYLGGHSDVVAGAIGASAERVRRLEQTSMYLGVFLSSSSCALLLRSLRTFELRMRRHCLSGQDLARRLAALPDVAAVHYGPPPGASQLDEIFSSYGGMLCIRFREGVDVDKLCASLTLVADVPSLGGTETTACQPLQTTHKWTSAEECESLGITDRLLRVSVGLEEPDDILQDFQQALALSLR